MQNETISRVVGGFLGAALVAVGITAFTPQIGAAQDPGQQPPPAGRMGGGRGPMGPGGPGMGRGGRGGGPMGLMGAGIDPRDLTDAQREQVKTIHDNHAAEIQPLAERVVKARETLASGVLSGSGDLQGLAIEVGNAEGALAYANAQIETEVLAVLTPEQRQKVQDRQKEMEARRAEMQKNRPARGAGQ
jgi:periplasmic protein CpxP/Spy